MKRPIAIIGGSGVKSLLKGGQKILGTPYGPTPSLTIGEIDGRTAVFLPRHGEAHSSPPHRVNYRANIWGLKTLGVERIIATNAVGAIEGLRLLTWMSPSHTALENERFSRVRWWQLAESRREKS